MILNIFRDWLGGFYINSLGLISGSDNYSLVVVEEKSRPPPAKQMSEVSNYGMDSRKYQIFGKFCTSIGDGPGYSTPCNPVCKVLIVRLFAIKIHLLLTWNKILKKPRFAYTF